MREKTNSRFFLDSFLFQAAALTAASLIVFGASIGFAFCLDDHTMFARIRQLPGPLAIFGAGDIFQTYYRPLFILSLAVEHSLTQAPWLQHLTNVLLHILVALMALAVARRLLSNSPWAFVAALAFAIHPSRAENVAWISGRTDLLASGGMLLALLLLLRARTERNVFLAALSGLSGILAMFSKETALLSPLLMLAGWWAIRPSPSDKQGQSSPKKGLQGRPGAVLVLCLVLQSAGIFLLLVLRSAAHSGVPMEPLFPTFGETLLNAARNFALYLWHVFTGGGEEYLVLGWRMVKSSGLNFMPLPSDAWHLLGISLALFLFLGWASWALLGIRVQDPARRQSHRVVLVSLSLFAAFLFPTLGVIPIQYNYSTRFLYLPLLFFVIALGGTLDLFFARGPTGKPSPRHPSSALALVCLALLLGGTVKTFRDTLLWKDDVTLFSFMTSRCPQVPVAFNCLAIGYRHRADKEARRSPAVLADWLNAAHYSERARRIWPQFGDAYLMEGGALRMAAQCDPLHGDSLLTAAIRAYIAGAQEIPDNPLLPMYAGDTYFGAGNLNAAEKAYQEALRRDPTNSDAQERLRVVAKMKGPSLK